MVGFADVLTHGGRGAGLLSMLTGYLSDTEASLPGKLVCKCWSSQERVRTAPCVVAGAAGGEHSQGLWGVNQQRGIKGRRVGYDELLRCLQLVGGHRGRGTAQFADSWPAARSLP